MSSLRKHMQAAAVVVGLLLLAIAAVSAIVGWWRVVAVAFIGVAALVLVMVAHMHQRVGDTLREVQRQQKQVTKLQGGPGRSAEDPDVREREARARRDQAERERRDVVEAVAREVQHDFTVSRGQLVARLDALESVVRTVARDLVGVTGDLDERARGMAEELERHNDGLDQSWASQFQRLETAVEAARRDAEQSLGLLRHLRHEPITEIDAMLQLHRRLPMDGPVPLMWGWALSPRALLQTVEVAMEPTCRLVVECGSGTSTIFLGKALQESGGGRLVALEHLPEVAASVREQAALHGLADIVEVRDAELTELTLGDDTYSWYDRAAVTDLQDIDLLLVDGPPAATGPMSRYPAVPVLTARLSAAAVVALDDVGREQEKAVLRRWLDEDPRLSRGHSLTSNLAVLHWQAAARQSSATPQSSAAARG